METFLERLFDEQKQLNKKIEKLSNFLQSEKFDLIAEEQKSFLMIQIGAMETYSRCLYERAKYLTKELG